jgi:hypothetical protein
MSILIYLRANLTAQRPITKSARIRRTKEQQNTNKIKDNAVYVIIIIRIIKLLLLFHFNSSAAQRPMLIYSQAKEQTKQTRTHKKRRKLRNMYHLRRI